MDSLNNGKFYSKDFSKFGVQYTNKLILDDDIETTKILGAVSGYETPDAIERFTQAVKTGYEAHMYLKYINEKIGYGVYADAPINEHDIIGEYTGRLIDQETAFQLPLEKTACLMALPDCYMGYNYPKTLYVDAMKAGNFTRFINHSYDPNVNSKLLYDGVLWHVLFTAAKNVDRNKQLFFNYGSGYWCIRGIEPIKLDEI